MLFVNWLRLYQNITLSTIATFVAAVRSLHIAFFATDHTLGADRLARLLRGVRLNLANSSPPRLPITNTLMGLIQLTLAPPSFNNNIFWAACCAAYFLVFCVLVNSPVRLRSLRPGIWLCTIFHLILRVITGFG